MNLKKKVVYILIIFSILASLGIQVVYAIPTFMLSVDEGDWAEYEVETAQNYTMYNEINETYIKIRNGDKIKYVIKGKVYSAFRGPTGGELCILQYPICDIYVNNNKIIENEILTLKKESLPPFLPIKTKRDSYYYFWVDIDRYYQYWENLSRILDFPYPNYTFIVEKDIVTVKIEDKYDKINVTAIYDKDTGVLRDFHLRKVKDEDYIEFHMIINDTNIEKALLPTPPWYVEYWYLWVLATLIVVFAVIKIKHRSRKKLKSY